MWVLAVRLHNRGASSYGRVEVYQDKKWQVVCDRNWDVNDASKHTVLFLNKNLPGDGLVFVLLIISTLNSTVVVLSLLFEIPNSRTFHLDSMYQSSCQHPRSVVSVVFIAWHAQNHDLATVASMGPYLPGNEKRLIKT